MIDVLSGCSCSLPALSQPFPRRQAPERTPYSNSDDDAIRLKPPFTLHMETAAQKSDLFSAIARERLHLYLGWYLDTFPKITAQ
jgi:hypothetical protein